MNSILFIFAGCTAANVILGTVKTLMTIKGGKLNAAIWNALSFGLYSYIVVLTANAELTTATKIIVTIICNLICVFGVKWVEEKLQKDSLWKFEITINKEHTETFKTILDGLNIPNNYIDNIGKYTIFNVYSKSKEESKLIHELTEKYKGKSFASETKLI